MLHSFRRVSVYFGLCFLLILSFVSWKNSWTPELKQLRPLTYYSGNGFVRTMILSDKCEKWIQNSIQLPIPALLVDQNILQQLQLNICNKMRLNRKIKIAVDAENFGSSKFDFENFELLRFYNHTDKDYLVFEVSSENKIIIPKNFSYKINNNLKVPTQISLFLDLWNRGNFVNCRNMTMRRDSTKKGIYTMLRNVLLPPRKPIPVLESVRTLAQLRDEMLKFGIFPFLNGGTFLGWYRECSVIPHTTDMDIAVFAENWNLQFSEFMWTHNSSFRVKRQLGLVNDSYELTLVPKNGFETPVDVFLMYKEIENGKENRWVGGLTTTGIKYKYMYPEYDPWCAADLMGHLFWVSCTPEDKIQKEYGNTWYLDENSSKYIWNAAQNAVENGRFSREQMKTETYNEYKINDFS